MKAMPVCDPKMSLSFRRWAAGQRPVFGVYGELTALSPGGSSGGTRSVAIACWLLAVAGLIVLALFPSAASACGWLAADAMAAIIAMITRFRSRRRDLRSCRTAVIFPESLDGPGLVFLARTQAALGTILGSRVRAAGLLADVPEQVLREHEWQIAGKLREVTELRRVLTANCAGASPGPMTTHVLSAQRQAIDVAGQAIAACVTALERYAQQVAAADHADRDWRDAIEMSKLNDRYLDLVARTASDEYVTSHLAGLAEQLATATAARNDRLHEADLAAEVLVLPGRPVTGLREPGDRVTRRPGGGALGRRRCGRTASADAVARSAARSRGATGGAGRSPPRNRPGGVPARPAR